VEEIAGDKIRRGIGGGGRLKEEGVKEQGRSGRGRSSGRS
jgi:hypothetical protein